MTRIELPGIRFLAEEATPPPEPANDNWGIAAEWQTPAEAMQIIRQAKAEMRRELAADFTLRANPEHRHCWEMVIGAEKCARWQFYGEWVG